MFKLGWGHCTKFYAVVEAEGGTPHIPIWNIWSNVQTRVGTPHKILRCLRSRGGDTAHSNWGKKYQKPIERGGTPHIYNEMKDRRVMDGWMVLCDYNATSWLHLASWNLPDSQLSWESKMEPSVAKIKKSEKSSNGNWGDTAHMEGGHHI